MRNALVRAARKLGWRSGIDLRDVEVRAAAGGTARHAENPRWDVHTQSFYWIDMPAGVLHRNSADGGTHNSWTLAPELSAMVLRDDGHVLVGTGNALHWFDPAIGTLKPWQVIPELDTTKCRFNDAAWAPDGSLWLASMARDGVSPLGALFRVTATTVDTLASNIKIGNGPAFDATLQRAYYADTPLREVYMVDLTKPFSPVLFVRFKKSEGYPDGMLVDSQGILWIAHYDGEMVSAWRSDGTRVVNLRLPGACPTAIAIGPNHAGGMLAAVTTSSLREMKGGVLLVRVRGNP